MQNKKKRVPIVDDDIDAFADPEEALSSFKNGLYDCLIIDIRLPR
jgi:DNA-binding response OmpR family regulator